MSNGLSAIHYKFQPYFRDSSFLTFAGINISRNGNAVFALAFSYTTCKTMAISLLQLATL